MRDKELIQLEANLKMLKEQLKIVNNDKHCSRLLSWIKIVDKKIDSRLKVLRKKAG